MLKIIGHVIYVIVAVFWLLFVNTWKMDGTAPIDAIPFLALIYIVVPFSIIAWIVFLFDLYEYFNKRYKHKETGVFLPVRLFATPVITMLVIATLARLY